MPDDDRKIDIRHFLFSRDSVIPSEVEESLDVSDRGENDALKELEPLGA
jgi:hypothetical protein